MIDAIAPAGAEAYVKSLTAGMLQLQGLGAAPAPLKGGLEGAAGSFQAFLSQAIDQTASLQRSADEKAKAFMAGELDDLHTLMIAQEKASLGFQLTLQVRNKVIEAYQEIMRMQI